MAYWNLHERQLEENKNQWMVNGQTPLTFFHFSGIEIDDTTQISRHQNRYDLNNRSDLLTIFTDYRKLLIKNSILDIKKLPYAYGSFTNGEKILHLARRMFATHEHDFGGENPFEAKNKVYQWCARNGFTGNSDESGKYNSMTYNERDWKVRIFGIGLRLLLKFTGANKYTIIMKYFSFISVIRNQKDFYKVQ